MKLPAWRSPMWRPAVVGLTGVVLLALGSAVLRGSVKASPVLPAEVPAAELQHIDQLLATWTRAASTDPYSAMFPAQVAALHLQRGRLTGEYNDALVAEEYSRKSLAQRTQHNGGAFVTLAAALLEQHRFAEANQVARQLVAGEPNVDAYQSLLGQTELELGDYEAAKRSFGTITGPSSGPSTMAGLARWAEIQGDNRTALHLLRVAREATQKQTGETREEVAWYHMREADIELRRGHANAASNAVLAGLAMAPSDYRLLAARARLAARRGEWRDAVRYGEASTFNVLDPTTLAVVATAYGELGDTAKVVEVERAASAAVSGQGGTLHRTWAMYNLDRDRHVDSILALARHELTIRRDVYTLDLLAWAEFKRGALADARRHMDDALRVGISDPLLSYHGGFVYMAAGDTARGEALLTRALELDDHSTPRYVSAARDLLDRVDAARDGQRTFGARTVARARRAVRGLARHEG